MAWVYILQSQKNEKYYIGSTTDLDRRKYEHDIGHSKYTSMILPVKIVFFQKYSSLKLARKVELWIKKQKSSQLINTIISDGKITKTFE